jgi:hypothetical protein
MKQTLIALDEKNQKTFGYDEQQIIISSKSHDTFESLQNAAVKSGLLESVTTIPVSDVTGLSFNEKESNFKIAYLKNGKAKSETILLSNNASRPSVVAELGNLKGFGKVVVEESKTKPLLMNVLGALFAGVVTYGLRYIAIDAQNGIEYEATGRRSGIKNLISSAASALGPTGVAVLGIAVVAYIIYTAYKRYNNPASVINYGV